MIALLIFVGGTVLLCVIKKAPTVRRKRGTENPWRG